MLVEFELLGAWLRLLVEPVMTMEAGPGWEGSYLLAAEPLY